MPFRFRSFVTVVTVIAAISAVLGLWFFATTLDDGSILPGVPPSDLERNGLEVQIAHDREFPIDASSAADIAQQLLCLRPEISGAIPIILRSDDDPVYAGPAWAVIVDTSTGYTVGNPPFGCAPPSLVSVSREHEYFVAFINAETGEWLRSLTPNDGVDDFTPTQVPGAETAAP